MIPARSELSGILENNRALQRSWKGQGGSKAGLPDGLFSNKKSKVG
jgi:hypothetical protein